MRFELLRGEGRTVQLGDPVGDGNDGILFTVPGTELLAKRYRKPQGRDSTSRLEGLIAQRPMGAERFTAWPVEVLRRSDTGDVQGILVPRVFDGVAVKMLRLDATPSPPFFPVTWWDLLATATSIAKVYEFLHASGWVVRVRANRLLASTLTWSVRLIGCDALSCMVDGRWLESEPSSPTYRAHSLVTSDSRRLEELEHDRYALAALTYELLFGGDPRWLSDRAKALLRLAPHSLLSLLNRGLTGEGGRPASAEWRAVLDDLGRERGAAAELAHEAVRLAKVPRLQP